MDTEKMTKNVSILGQSGQITYKDPDEAKQHLECFDNQWTQNDYVVYFHCPEFTCVCPKTGQPDFAVFHIWYIPNVKMVESKCLKLYMQSYRNFGCFHEFVTNKIAHDLFDVMGPKGVIVKGEYLPRGGISIHPIVELYGVFTSEKIRVERKLWQVLRSQI